MGASGPGKISRESKEKVRVNVKIKSGCKKAAPYRGGASGVVEIAPLVFPPPFFYLKHLKKSWH